MAIIKYMIVICIYDYKPLLGALLLKAFFVAIRIMSYLVC